jgi:hypothetical protein
MRLRLGGAGWQVIDWRAEPPTLKKGITRDEQVQANYLKEQLDIFAGQNILGAFVYTFINPTQIYSSNPAEDFDMASYGIVRPIDPGRQQPGRISWGAKAAFEVLADYYK